MFGKVKQIFIYLFSFLYRIDLELLKELDENEKEIFIKMSKYDKIHSIRVYKSVCKSEILKDRVLWRKVALLHDCGKSTEITLIERIWYAITKRYGVLKEHPKIGYKKLKDINYDLAKLIKIHHDKSDDILLNEFQKCDNES